MITPLLNESDAFDEDSVDLRLGTHFLLPQVPPLPFIDPNSPESANQAYLRIHVALGGYFVLPAHQTVLGATLEFIKLPFDVSGEILTKSSVARMFMVIETAPWIHPLYRGCLTLEIANVSNTAIALYPGMHIGQLVLAKTTIRRPAKKLSGAYVGPIYPEAPMLKVPAKELRKIGLTKYRHPFYGWVREQEMEQSLANAFTKLKGTPRDAVINVLNILRAHGGIHRDNPVNSYIDADKKNRV